MANYCCTVTTNWFHVTDEKRFREIIDNAVCDGNIKIFTKDPDGLGRFSFGAYAGHQPGYPVDAEGEICSPDSEDMAGYDAETFHEGLTEVLPEGEVIFIMEVGNEALRYCAGTCAIITRYEVRYLNLADEALKLAREMLGDAGYMPDYY